MQERPVYPLETLRNTRTTWENVSYMFPSNRTVIVQNNINEAKSLNHKDTDEEQKKKVV